MLSIPRAPLKLSCALCPVSIYGVKAMELQSNTPLVGCILKEKLIPVLNSSQNFWWWNICALGYLFHWITIPLTRQFLAQLSLLLQIVLICCLFLFSVHPLQYHLSSASLPSANLSQTYSISVMLYRKYFQVLLFLTSSHRSLSLDVWHLNQDMALLVKVQKCWWKESYCPFSRF